MYGRRSRYYSQGTDFREARDQRVVHSGREVFFALAARQILEGEHGDGVGIIGTRQLPGLARPVEQTGGTNGNDDGEGADDDIVGHAHR